MKQITNEQNRRHQMKKYISSILVVALVSFTSLAFAGSHEHSGGHPSQDAKIEKRALTVAQCEMQILGKVVSINDDKNEIVVKDQQDNKVKIFLMDPDDLQKIKTGDIARLGFFHTSTCPSHGYNKVQEVELVTLPKKGK
jgi:hypothetical protein